MNPEFKTQCIEPYMSGAGLEGNKEIDFLLVSGTTTPFPPGIEEQVRLTDIETLRLEVSELKKELKELRDKRILTTKESLVRLWDNEYDDQWNDL